MTRFGDHLYVAGGRCASDGTARLTVVNPATEQPLGRAAEGTAGDVDRAVTAARAALPDWSGRPGEESEAGDEVHSEEVDEGDLWV